MEDDISYLERQATAPIVRQNPPPFIGLAWEPVKPGSRRDSIRERIESERLDVRYLTGFGPIQDEDIKRLRLGVVNGLAFVVVMAAILLITLRLGGLI